MLGLAGMTTTASAAPKTGSITTPVTGTVNGLDQSGTLTITEFTTSGGVLNAVGTLDLGAAVNDVPVTVPVNLQQTTGTCEILTLVLGPLHLDLLGLVIDLNQVVLKITAEQGPGNLLGNLLCAIAGLLDGPGGALGGLAALLNRILAILG
jgi:hypothetical protein